MAKIVQSLTQPPREYDQSTFLSLVRDLNGLIEKLNTRVVQLEQFRWKLMGMSLLFPIILAGLIEIFSGILS